jgi:hypothetical protein
MRVAERSQESPSAKVSHDRPSPLRFLASRQKDKDEQVGPDGQFTQQQETECGLI